ncbi:14937_t:CDS:2 [Funneliformis geosporum]|uniref:14937_t:CDS:1 n=1 Tax=Funneliformis geosporum TaxID=1117311 RepID=A0A9W4SW42_9GLOM|nr:14937_t:CDS:2 [Funneliformis geosporum]
MTSLYAQITALQQLTDQEKTSLRTYFTQNPAQKCETIEVLSICLTDKDKVAYLNALITPGLAYVRPQPLLASLGLQWEYQLGSLKEALLSALRQHYKDYQDEPNATRAIGNQMLLQLLPGQQLEDIINVYMQPFPLDVLRLVAKHENKGLKDATVILVVDRLQNFMKIYDDGLDLQSMFYKTLSTIGDLAMKGPFLIPCCTATINRPVVNSLMPSKRKHVYLLVPPLEPPTIGQQQVFQIDDHLIKLLVYDCGRHRRTLEILAEVMQDVDLRRCDFSDLMRRLRDQLAGRYSEVTELTPEDVDAIVRAILTHQLLDADKALPGTNKRPDQIESPRLIRFVKGRGSTGEQWRVVDPEMSQMLDEDKKTKISEVYFGSQTDTRTHRGKNKNNTKSLRVQCEHDTIEFRACENIIINKTSAPYGDSFLALDTKPPRNEATSEEDFFILFTTQKAENINLSPYSGIVDGTCWEAYYGPFAGRAFIYNIDGPLDINTATRSTLQLVDGIGPALADCIMRKRPFQDILDAHKRTSVPEVCLKKFKFGK